MIIRNATISDLSAIVELAIESVSKDPLPVTVDPSAMRETGRQMIGNAKCFVWVAEVDGEVVAAVAAAQQPSFWFRGSQVSVLLFWSRAPGAGVRLMRQLMAWIKGRPAVKVAVIECEPHFDWRTKRFIKRLGFYRESTNLTYVRNANV